MNERIRQLADEAGLRFTQLMSNPMVPVVDGKETDLAKFAELIVKECLAVCQHDTDDDDDQFDLGRAHQAKQTAELIKTHFGVEL